jgi:amidase
VVAKLRDAGTVIIGKNTMGQWAQMRSRKASSSHGWSAYGGQTLGAYYPQQDPSGSSSGSAVAISIGLALGSLATETSGSIVLPAEKSNVVGIKPTLGLTSRSMVIPISLRQDTVGPVAKTIKDAAHILSVISGQDKHDNWTSAQPFGEVPDYAKACNYYALREARLGVPRNGISPFLSGSTEPVMAAFEMALKLIRTAGAKIVDKADFAAFDIDAFGRNSSIVLGTDFVAGLSDYFAQLTHNPNNVHSLDDVAQFTRNDLREEYPDRGVRPLDPILECN